MKKKLKKKLKRKRKKNIIKKTLSQAPIRPRIEATSETFSQVSQIEISL